MDMIYLQLEERNLLQKEDYIISLSTWIGYKSQPIYGHSIEVIHDTFNSNVIVKFIECSDEPHITSIAKRGTSENRLQCR